MTVALSRVASMRRGGASRLPLCGRRKRADIRRRRGATGAQASQKSTTDGLRNTGQILRDSAGSIRLGRRYNSPPCLTHFSARQRQATSSNRTSSRPSIAQAKEERTALSAMLTQMAGGTSKLAQTSKALEQVGQKADAALKRLDDLGQKVTGYEDRVEGSRADREAHCRPARAGARSAAGRPKRSPRRTASCRSIAWP